ncbi:MAG: bifunctional pyr operon transcriptional regulator/uracil phosphoribosyltransferase PyrR [Deltaproteobacteria bacterium]|nr:bifunctional pyr operon transcriptional regulator/uracil phosphoribosyltransferase PyrR [Deltaproteobacteria bacterium]
MKGKKVVMDAEGIDRSLTRIAYEILEVNQGSKDLILVGIQKGGVALARRLGDKIAEKETVQIPLGILDITLYRDDVMSGNKKPKMGKTDIPVSLNNKKVILVDDVLFTGRTIRAAMDALMDFGRPKLIQVAVLIDRGHRELPIMANYVGNSLPSSLWEKISVNLLENSGIDEVIIEES